MRLRSTLGLILSLLVRDELPRSISFSTNCPNQRTRNGERILITIITKNDFSSSSNQRGTVPNATVLTIYGPPNVLVWNLLSYRTILLYILIWILAPNA